MAGPVSAVVLAGGASRRLGVDKTALAFDGRPLLQIIVERLAPLCAEIIVACGSRDAGERPPLPVQLVKDAMPGQGPLGGLQAGLAMATSDFALVVACDMPFLNRRLLRHMAALPRRYQVLVPRLGDRRHPTHAIYCRSCLPIVEGLLAQGGNCMEELLARLDVVELPEGEVRRFDPEGLSLFNINGPDDLARARAIWERPEGHHARSA